MTWYLFHALPPMCQLVLVGDADQLPSVGPGAVLSELLRCGRIPMVMLDKVFRQSEGSMIAENARHIRHGDTDLQFDRDFQFWGSADIRQSAEWLERLYMQEVCRYGVDNVALLTPFRAKTETGVRSMNERLRTLVNPPGANKPELSLGQRIFRFGDKVMQTKFHNFLGSSFALRRLSDRVCLEHDLSVIQNPKQESYESRPFEVVSIVLLSSYESDESNSILGTIYVEY